MANPKYDQLPEEVVDTATAWLEALGYGMDTEHTSRTPVRISWYIREVLAAPRDVHISAYKNEPRMEDMIIVNDIPIWAACSHHLLPFFGRADFGYIPGEKILGLSKIPLTIQQIAKGPWVQEHLTHEIAGRLHVASGALGTIVRIECTHTCMMLDLDSGRVPSMITCALRGIFAYNPAAKEEFMQHIRR